MADTSSALVGSLLQVTHTAVHTYPFATLFLTPFVWLFIRSLYRVSPLHPLYHVPGPKFLPRLTSLYLLYHAYKGDECTTIQSLHDQYGPVVRTGPLSVDIIEEFDQDADDTSDSGSKVSSAVHDIYVEKGGFPKANFYANFDIDGHKSIFSNTDARGRAERAKVVAGLFSMKELRKAKGRIDAYVDGFVARWRREVENAQERDGHAAGRFDILGICRSLAIDVVTGYLLGQKYGACEEDLTGDQQKRSEKEQAKSGTKPATMSASAMVDAFVAVGRLWYLPPWAFSLVDRLITTIWPDLKAAQSIDQVYSFVSAAVDNASLSLDSAKPTNPSKEGTDSPFLSYPARLLSAGFSISETNAQCKDIIFAGTDSTGTNLATLIYNLIKHPQIYRRLQTEPSTPTQDSPLLHAVLKESLRLAMANPSRLPRLVPQGRPYTYTSATNTTTTNNHKTYTFPPGTTISCTPHHLHFNPFVFPLPHTFDPDRWLHAPPAALEKMSRSHIAFGLGSRACIARNLATMELETALRKVVEEDLLSGLRVEAGRGLEIRECFNSMVVGGGVEVLV